jgi:hypothetical protein
MLNHTGVAEASQTEGGSPVPAIQSYFIEPIWEQFSALLPSREVVEHPLVATKPRISEKVVFEKLVQVLVFGCAYHRRIAYTSRVRTPPCAAAGATSGD